MDTRRLDAGGQEEQEPGWQDTDSEGLVNDWQLEGMDVQDEEQQVQQEQQHEQPQPTPLLAAAVHPLHHDIIDLTQLQDNVQQIRVAIEPTQHQPQHGIADATPDAADAAATQQRPLHRHIAALINRRVRALLHQAMQEATTAEDAAALQTLLQHTTDLAAGAGGAGSSSSGSSSNGGSNDADDMNAELDEPAEGCTRFDPNVTASHQYLGDVDELEGTYGLLPEGTTARLPLLLLDGVVLFPGCQLPLLLNSSAEQRLIDRALTAPPPLTRLLAVLPGPRSWMHSMHRLVACTAEVRQMRRQSEAADGAGQQLAVLALGRQRAEVVQEQHIVARSQSSVLVRILGEGCQRDVPQALRCCAAAIHPALAAPWDLQLLVGRVRQIIQLVLPPVASFKGTPLELSYWVSHNLPLQPSTRQLLLTASCPAERLRLLLGLLERLDQLECSGCRGRLATTADVMAMTSEGIAGTFVNSHGYVHEMVTFRRVHNITLEGQPETAHSWFPGYAWTIAYCSSCGQHLGWRFTAAQPGLAPRLFWGLRRQVLTCSTRAAAAAAGREGRQGGHGEGGDLAVGGAVNVVIPLGDLPVAAAGTVGAGEQESEDDDDDEEDDEEEEEDGDDEEEGEEGEE